MADTIRIIPPLIDLLDFTNGELLGRLLGRPLYEQSSENPATFRRTGSSGLAQHPRLISFDGHAPAQES
jgi:hypothetical protein